VIGERIRQLRGKEPQADFGVKFGLSRNTVMRYESGARDPDAGLILALCQEYNINAHWLITGEGPKHLGGSDSIPADQQSQDNRTVMTMPGDSLGMAEGMTILGRIYGSGDQVFIRAINANLHAFNEALDNKAQAQQAINQLNAMEKRMAVLEKRLTKLEEENEVLRKGPPGHKQQAEG